MTGPAQIWPMRSSQNVPESSETGSGQKKSGQSGSWHDHLPCSQRQMGAQTSKPPHINPSAGQQVPSSGGDVGSASTKRASPSVQKSSIPGHMHDVAAVTHCRVNGQEPDGVLAATHEPPAGSLGPVSHAKSAAHAAAEKKSQKSLMSIT